MVVSKRTAVSNLKRELHNFFGQTVCEFFEDNNTVSFNTCCINVYETTGSIELSFNTPFDYYKKLYQHDLSRHASCTEERAQIEAVRYSLSEWHYQAVATLTPLEADVYETYFLDNRIAYLRYIEQIVMNEFEQSCWSKFSRTEDFELSLLLTNINGTSLYKTL